MTPLERLLLALFVVATLAGAASLVGLAGLDEAPGDAEIGGW